MKLFWIIFILQTCHAFCNGITQSIQRGIKKTFGYNCEEQPNIGEILFWKIPSRYKVKSYNYLWHALKIQKEFKPEKYVHGITRFQSNKMYFILTKIDKYRLYIFYWLGSQVSLNDKKVAANYTLQCYSQLKNYYHSITPLLDIFISREMEAIESELFQHLIISPNENISKPELYNYYQHTGILLTYPHLYIVKGFAHNTCIKRVPISILWLKNDTCIILEVSYSRDRNIKLFLYCGTMANEAVYKRASSFTSFICWRYLAYFDAQSHVVNKKDPLQFKLLIELLEDKSYYRPNEVDNSNDHLKDAETFVRERNAKISLSRIFNGDISNTEDSSPIMLEGGLIKEKITHRPPLCNNLLLNNSNHLFNTDSISGVFVQFGSPILEEAVITMQHAEEYVHNMESIGSRPIPLHIDGAVFPNNTIIFVNLKINFSDYPPVGWHV